MVMEYEQDTKIKSSTTALDWFFPGLVLLEQSSGSVPT